MRSSLCAAVIYVAGATVFGARAQEVVPEPERPVVPEPERPSVPGLERKSALDGPFVIEADRLTGYQSGQFHAQGSVSLHGRGMQAWAQDLFGSMPDNEISGSGAVRLDRFGDVIEGQRFFLDLDTNSGYVDDASYKLKKYRAHGKARSFDFPDKEHLRATQATYTTCDLGKDDWYLKVSQLDIDRVRDVGEARHVVMRFKEIPILYTPWIDFPVASNRKSGLLAPVFGTTQTGGFEFTQPIYLNLAPNYDATVAPRFITRRGLMLNGEARYLERSFSGELRGEYLDEDRLTANSRYGLVFKHRQNLGGGFSANLDYSKVSDDRYFVDLSDKIAVTSQTNLPREGSIEYNASWWGASLRMQRFQTLQDPLAPVTPPYARVPQLLLNAARPNQHGVDLAFSGEVVNFDHPTQVSAIRQLYYPNIQVPFENAYVNVIPKIGVHYRRYHFQNSDRRDESITLPIASLDVSTTLERDTNLFGRTYLQTLEPRLYYVYIPFKDQNRLPLFDTAEADFNLGQIFTENQFTGGDRVNDANQLTAAISSRLLDPDTGEERLRGILGQRYYFKDQEVSLNDQVREFNRSDILAAVSGRISREWEVSSALQYDVNNSQSRKLSAIFHYQPEPGMLVNFGYRYQRDFLKTVDISTQWQLSSRWTGLARWNYSLSDHKLVEGLAGLEYNAGCWAVRMVAHRFATATEVAAKTFFIQIEFTGLTGLGSNPLEVLRQNIYGYTKTNDLSRNAKEPEAK